MNRFQKIWVDWPKFFFRTKPADRRGALPIITISREMGSGGKAIANLVAKKLDSQWRVFDSEVIEAIAKDAKLEKKLADSVDEKKRFLVDQLIKVYFGRRLGNLSGYHKHLIRVMTLIGQRGFAIILGRGGNFIYPHALNVRIICDTNQRITWEMIYEKISRNEAVRRINASDFERTDFVKKLFNHNPKKAHHYDMVIRTGPNLTIEDAAEVIVDLAKRKLKI